MADVEFMRTGAAGIITLNRPAALNALTLGMVRRIHPRLQRWAEDRSVGIVIMRGAGDKAFCAGGDIRALYDWGRTGAAEATAFFREEYLLNTCIKAYPKPVVALMDGITMGGGVGLSVHGDIRVVTQRFVFAMPETGIGLFPDVGGSWFLPRCPGRTGLFLALTGTRLGPGDALALGIATHYAPAADLPGLVERLATGIPPEQAVHDSSAPHGSLGVHRPALDRCFAADDVAAIHVALEREARRETPTGADGAPDSPALGSALAGPALAGPALAGPALAAMAAKSPLSQMIACRQLHLGATASFRDCMRMEMRLATRFMAGHDFYEGVRAAVIDRDHAPAWHPASLAQVTPDMVQRYFAPLESGELEFPDETKP